MMIRSVPPASAHFAESPVPAPAPMSGAPGSDLGAELRERLRSGHDASSISSCSRFAIASANGGIVHVRLELMHLDLRRVDQLAERVEERCIGLAVVEHLALGRDRRHTAQRDEQHRRPLRRVQLPRDDPPDLPALLRCRPHQRDGGVVDVEVPVAIPLRNRLHRPEVHHVERSERDDLRDAAPSRRLEPIGHGDEHAARDEVAELGRRDVERAGDEPGLDQLLHRAATRTGLMEDEDLVAELLEPLPCGRDRCRRDAEHRGRDQWLLLAERRHLAFAMPASAAAAFVMICAEIRLTPAMSTTEYIIVTSTEPTYGLVSPEATVETISLGMPIGSCAHRVGRERRAAGAAEAADRVEPSLGMQALDDLGGAAGHRLHRRTAVAGGREGGDVGAGRGSDLLPRDVGRNERLADDACVDEHDVDAVLADPVGEIGVLPPLRVERADENDGGHLLPPSTVSPSPGGCPDGSIREPTPMRREARRRGSGAGRRNPT